MGEGKILELFINIKFKGTLHLKFDSNDKFMVWKELEEEATYTAYVKRQASYQPKFQDGIIKIFLIHLISSFL